MKSITHYKHNPGDPSSLSDNITFSLLVDKNGTLWIGTQKGGLNKFDRVNKKFTSYKHNSDDPGSISSNYITSMYEDDSGYLWLGTAGGGLEKFDRGKNKFTHYMHDPDDEASLSSNDIWSIYGDSENKLWIGTVNDGLCLFDRNKNRFIQIRKSYDPEGLNDTGIFSILEDRSGILWFGTWSGGLNKYDKAKEKFKTYAHNPNDKNSLGSNEVYSIYVDKFNELWIGTAGGGMDRFDKSRKKVSHYTFDPNDPSSIGNNSVNSICEDKDGYIWIGTYGGGINRYDRKTNKFTRYNNDPDNKNSISSNNIGMIHFDSRGNLWIGIEGQGMDKFIMNENKFVHYKNNINDKNSISEYLVYSIYEDRKGNIWIGTNGGGLLKYDSSIDGFICYKHDAENLKTSLSNDVVSVILEDKKGNVWAGTSLGINKFRPDKMEFRHYTEKDGLINDMVTGILEDDNGYLWISTGKGISRFEHDNEQFTNYDATSGLQGTEFNPWAYFKGVDGKMYFGGTNGLTVFDAKDIKDNTHIPEIVITDINILHKPVSIGYDSIFGRKILEKSITETELLELNYDENVILFEISALDYKNPQKNMYAYFLEGFDKTWTYKDASQRYITYTNLNPGRYTLKVKGSNSDGIWNKKGISLSIIIGRPWWRTWWAYSLYIIIFVFTFTGSTRVYLNRKVLRNQLELEHEHSKKLAEVEEIKSNFFTNISHEFRTPLTLIMGPSNNIIHRSIDEEAKNQAKIIKRNADRLLRLINQLLDLSKLDEKQLKLHATESNIVSFIKGTVMSFEAFAERKDLNLKIITSKDDISLFFDRDKMENIITNLLSNAIKFTPGGGTITVKINEKDDDRVEIKISDTGIGIPEKELPKLFDRFYQVDNSQTREYEGSGLGLSLTKELVELHHGTINVESNVRNPETGKPGWTEITIELPKGRYHLNEDEVFSIPEITEKHKLPEIEERYSPGKSQEEKETGDIKDDKTIILVVEDNKEVREYIREFLSEEYCVEEAINGEQGVRKAENLIPDLIVSDIMMPKMDGNQLTRTLKNEEKTSHIPIILLTAKSEHESRIAGLESGADDYLVKPFDTEELKIRIKNLIENRRKLQEKFRKGEITTHRTDKHLGTLDKNFINKINTAVEKHLSEEAFSIEDLGREINMSRSQVHRKLTALTGKSPSLYMRSMRLTRAKQMILDQENSISEIAYSVGFSSPAYFTRCFKEEFGFPPSEIYNKQFKV